MTRGELAIIAATILIVGAIVLGIIVAKVEGVVPGGAAACPPAQSPAGIESEGVGGSWSPPTTTPAGSMTLVQTQVRELPASLRESPSATTNGPGGLDIRKEGGCGDAAHERGDARPIVRGCNLTPVADRQRGISGSSEILGQPPSPSDVNLARRAADKQGVPVPSAIRLPRGADESQAQARLVGFITGDRYPALPEAYPALALLRAHESSNGKRMVGDGGKAQGWLQQHQDHWQVGCEVLGVDWPWPADTRDLFKCEMVAIGNWLRYARGSLVREDVEMLVRTFRLPSKPHRADNDAYWSKVKEVVP